MNLPNRKIIELFEDGQLVRKIKVKLPYLFQLAEEEASRNGKVGMEVGSVRERILVALLKYKFGERNVDTSFDITESELDAKVYDEGISIKSITGSAGVKAIWTVDAAKALKFRASYNPKYDILLAQINWRENGGLYLIPIEVQRKVLNRIGRESYLTLPPAGKNPRGVEISRYTMPLLISDDGTKKIEIHWSRDDTIIHDIYKKWLDQWMAP